MNSFKSKISVIMSAYNTEKFIKEAIESILSQTFADFEVLIINDASTDSTESIIKSYNDPRIKLIKNDKNLGLTKSLNIGLDLAKGKYIARMDADDISLPERFQKQFDFMEQDRGIDICGSWYELFGDKEGIVSTPVDDQDIKDTLFFYNCIAHPTVMMRKESMDKYNVKYNERFSCSQDYDLWCRFSDKFRFANIPEVLLKYRMHESQIGTAKREKQDEIANIVRKRSLEDIGIILDTQGLYTLQNVIYGDYVPNDHNGFLKVIMVLNQIGKAGSDRYGSRFRQMIFSYLRSVANKGLMLKITSIKLFFTVFRDWRVFPTLKDKSRYIYNSIRNFII